MSLYQLSKETPPGSGLFVPVGDPVEAADPVSDPEIDALPGCIVAIIDALQTASACWCATKVG